MRRHFVFVCAVVCLFPYALNALKRILLAAGIVCLLLMSGPVWAQVVAGQNINMVSGTGWPAGDPFLQRQNEPSMAVSSRNPEHLLAGANDYRTVDIPDTQSPNETGDAWMGVFTSMDGGETWKSTLLPGYPQDTSAVGTASPLRQYTVATDPTVRAGTHGLFYMSGLGFNRGTNAPSGVYVAVFQDQNNKGNGDAAILQGSGSGQHGNPFLYVNVSIVDSQSSGQFLDKPWVAVDIPRPGRTATCKIGGQPIQSGYVYVVYTQFNGSKNNPASKIKVAVSTNCGATWGMPQVVSQSEKLAQGTVAAIDPSNGNVHIAWRQIAAGSQNQPDAIQYAYSTDGGSSFNSTPIVHTFVTSNTTTFPAGSVFDQPSGTEFRTLDVPSIAVDGSSRVWIAYSQRVNGPTSGTYGSRIMVTTLPAGSKTWSTPYIADKLSPTLSAYGHQFMPALSFAFGKMMLAWFDSRNDNKESILACPGGGCTNLAQLTPQSIPIPGSSVATPASVFTPYILDPNSGIRHTIDVFGAMIDPATQTNIAVPSFQISQYPFWVNDGDGDQIEQGFFNPPNLPMFAKGTLPFVGDYIDIGAQNIAPSGGGWAFNSQGKDAVTGATLAPDFHITWTDNRDVVPPPIVSGNQDWAQYAPPNSGNPSTSIYTGTGMACPTCSTTQPACQTVTAADGTQSAYSGDRNENVYTSRVSNGLIVRFRENAKQFSTTVPVRSFSLLVKNTVSPLSTTPPGAPSYYRIMLGVTSTSQTPTCMIPLSSVGTASLSASGCTAYIDVAVNPKTTLAQTITVNSSVTANVNVLVAQINGIPAPGNPPSFSVPGLQALAAINGDTTNPSVANPDFLSTDYSNPDALSPYGSVSIVAGESYDPTVDGPPDPGINTPKIGTPLINTPKIAAAYNTPKIDTPTVVTIANNTPKIFSVQVVNPTIVDTINTPKINTPKINTPKIVSPEINTPKITSPSDITDYTWNVNNKGNTSSSYNTTEFVKSSGVQCCPANCSNTNSCGSCSVCQLVQHKVYESPVANRDSNTGNPTCDLNVQQESIVVANISDPAFVTGGVGGGNPSDPTSSTLSLSPGEGNRVTLRVVAPPVAQGTPFKTVASGQIADSNGQSATSLTIQTAALPVAVVNQPYIGAQLLSLGGVGVTLWSIPVDPANPAPVIGAGPFTLPVSPLNLAESGQIGTGIVTQSPGGPYPFYVQVQDSATTSNVLTPSFDVQQLSIEVNRLSVSSITATSTGVSGYLKANGSATVAVTIQNDGPATASSVTPTLHQHPTAAGGGPAPALTCGTPFPSLDISPGASLTFIFTCTAGGLNSGNGSVAFSATGMGTYHSPGAADVTGNTDFQTQPASPSLIVDTTLPVLTLVLVQTNSQTYTPGNWTNHPVTVVYDCTDNLSGVGLMNPMTTVINPSGPSGLITDLGPLHQTVSVTATADSANTAVSASCQDVAGNVANPPPAVSPIMIDQTKPILTVNAVAVTSNYIPGTWTNQSVTVTYTCTDNLSGSVPATLLINGLPNGVNPLINHVNNLISTAAFTLTAETAGTTPSATCSDVATNTASTLPFGPIMIDKTPPALSASAVAGLNAYVAGNWTNQNVTVTYACVDTLSAVANSGVASFAPLQQIFNTETSSGSSTGTCTDLAGNVSTVTFSPIMIDKTPPVLTVSAATADNNPYSAGVWTNQNVTVTYACADNASPLSVNSGLAAGSPTGSQTFTQETPIAGTSASGSCSDNAGNIATNAPLSFGPVKIDKTAPTVTGSATAGGNPYTAGTWTNQPVVVTFACADTLSGPNISTITGNVTDSIQQTSTASGGCKDIAGNLGTGTFGPINIDTTGPAIVVASPTSNQQFILNSQITPSFSCGESSGGIDTVNCTATPSGLPYTATPVGPGTFSVSATDQAGNSATSGSIPYVVIYSLTGFLSPLQPATPTTAATQSDSGSFGVGTTIPVQWQLQDATPTYISALSTLKTIQAFSNAACTGGPTGSPIPLYDSSNPSLMGGFTFNATTNTFSFAWNTTGLSVGCYNLVVTLDDTTQNATIVHLF